MALAKQRPAAKKSVKVKPNDPVQVKYLGNFGGRKKDEISTVHRALAQKLVEHKKVTIVEDSNEE